MIVNSTSSAATVQNESQETDANFQAATDFNTFLTLLTAQMRNQDPLEPMDSTAFVAQLASFSAVEQQIQTNEKLDHLISLFSTSADNGLAEWIGQDMRSSAPVRYNGSPLEVEFNVDPNVTSSKLVVENNQGVALYEQAISAGDHGIIWSGETSDNEALTPEDSYTFSIVSEDAEGLTTKASAEVVSSIAEIRQVNGDMVFVLENGNTYPLSDFLT